jgi:hypothetical protein
MFENFNFEEFELINPHKYVVDNINKYDQSRPPEYKICRTRDLKYSVESWDSEIQADNARRLGEFTIGER